MKYIVYIVVLAIILLAISSTLAKQETLVLGSYYISFDAGKNPQNWMIADESSESYGGLPYTDYHAKGDHLYISVTRYSEVPDMDLDRKSTRLNSSHTT
jgi:hypothetical protein